MTHFRPPDAGRPLHGLGFAAPAAGRIRDLGGLRPPPVKTCVVSYYAFGVQTGGGSLPVWAVMRV